MSANVNQTTFGLLPDGKPVEIFTLTNRHGLLARIMSFGATLVDLRVPDRAGKPGDVTLGFESLDGYLKGHPYFGSTVGRFANRIAKGRFVLDGKTYSLATNNGPNALHGGLKGFDKVLWKAEPQPATAVKFSYTSPDGEEGYPGTLKVAVLYTLTDANELRLDYTATTTQATPVNLTNHAYWNLAGTGDVLSHEVMIAAEKFTPVDATLIPSGELRSVKRTPMDFTQSKPIGRDLRQLGGDPQGYDHNFVLNSGSSQTPALAARVEEPTTGRVMEIFTTEPGVQFYTGNFLDGTLTGKGGVVYQRHAGFCLETQHFPDSVNQPSFPNTILRPGQTLRSSTVHRFSVK